MTQCSHHAGNATLPPPSQFSYSSTENASAGGPSPSSRPQERSSCDLPAQNPAGDTSVDDDPVLAPRRKRNTASSEPVLLLFRRKRIRRRNPYSFNLCRRKTKEISWQPALHQHHLSLDDAWTTSNLKLPIYYAIVGYELFFRLHGRNPTQDGDFFHKRGCGFFLWHDPEPSERSKTIINELKRNNKKLMLQISELVKSVSYEGAVEYNDVLDDGNNNHVIMQFNDEIRSLNRKFRVAIGVVGSNSLVSSPRVALGSHKLQCGNLLVECRLYFSKLVGLEAYHAKRRLRRVGELARRRQCCVSCVVRALGRHRRRCRWLGFALGDHRRSVPEGERMATVRRLMRFLRRSRRTGSEEAVLRFLRGASTGSSPLRWEITGGAFLRARGWRRSAGGGLGARAERLGLHVCEKTRSAFLCFCAGSARDDCWLLDQNRTYGCDYAHMSHVTHNLILDTYQGDLSSSRATRKTSYR
ncbi:hypothetical protein ZIOFF_059682 [Zingiber officinale]|uniref:Uncharacterized protein n=1 Tax=Zingiber officinale TaxID=94328 RepID=A0A8J5F582_ZINOF|nr:hypothetical protein ZIOFF_059682 [Zingiber officinale]